MLSLTQLISLFGQKKSNESLPVVIASDQSAIRVTVQSPAPVSGTVTVDQGTNPWTVVQSPNEWVVAGETRTLAPTYLDGQENALSLTLNGALRVDNSGIVQPVIGTVTANQGTSPWIISGSVTANAGTNLNTSALALAATQTDRTQKTQITDGTRDGTVKAGSTPAGAADTSFVVGLSPNSPLPTGSNTIGALTANQSVNVNQWGGTGTTLGQKAMTASVPVVIASDQSAVTVAQATAANLNAQVVGNAASAASDSGNPVKIGAKYNSTLPTVTNGQRIDAQANAFGELSVRPRNKYLNITGNTTTTVKSGAGVLGLIAVNNGANATTITVYDNTTATGTKIATIAVLGINTNVMSSIVYNCEFSTGLTIVTAGSANNDITVTYQ